MNSFRNPWLDGGAYNLFLERFRHLKSLDTHENLGVASLLMFLVMNNNDIKCQLDIYTQTL